MQGLAGSPQEPVDEAKAYYRPLALAAFLDSRQFDAVLEQLLDELHDGGHHQFVDQNWADSWCLAR